LSLLAFLSRQARWALPAGVFVGILFPRLAELLRPLLTPAVIGTLTGALLRLDWSRFADLGRRPLLPAALAIWQLLLSPLLVWFGSAAGEVFSLYVGSRRYRCTLRRCCSRRCSS